MSIRAIVFDFDGLILDTESMALQCWQQIYAEYGQQVPADLWIAALGCKNGTFDPYVHLARATGRPLERSVLRAKRKELENQLLCNTPACPGICDYLDAANALSLKLAVASSSPRHWVAGNLERLGLLARFDHLICAEDTSSHKPDPAPFLAAARALHVAPHEAIALEDSPNGITAARAAGLFAVAVPNPVTRNLDLSHADLVLDPLTACPLPSLIAQAEVFSRRHNFL